MLGKCQGFQWKSGKCPGNNLSLLKNLPKIAYFTLLWPDLLLALLSCHSAAVTEYTGSHSLLNDDSYMAWYFINVNRCLSIIALNSISMKCCGLPYWKSPEKVGKFYVVWRVFSLAVKICGVWLYRIECKKVCACSIRPATASGSLTRPSYCFLTKKTCLKRRLGSRRWLSAFQNTPVCIFRGLCLLLSFCLPAYYCYCVFCQFKKKFFLIFWLFM